LIDARGYLRFSACVLLPRRWQPHRRGSPPNLPRAAFLKLIDRKRVPLAPQTRVRPDNGRYAAEHFTFAPEAGERVTGILMAHASAAAGVRRDRAAWHGRQERRTARAAQRTLADRGLTGIAIDARYHGERARNRSGAALTSTSARCCRRIELAPGHPYMYDTVWDTMRLVDTWRPGRTSIRSASV
jgi:hypothetical protein